MILQSSGYLDEGHLFSFHTRSKHAIRWPNHELQHEVRFGRWKGRVFNMARGWRIALILQSFADWRASSDMGPQPDVAAET